MSRILVTGNPNYDGLCKGIYEAYNRNRVEFVGRWNGWDLGDFEKLANHAKDFDIFVNSQYGPNGEQVDILNAVYNKFEQGHIINISSTTSYYISKTTIFTSNCYSCINIIKGNTTRLWMCN